MPSLTNPAYPLIRTQELFEAYFTPFTLPGSLPLVERESDTGLIQGSGDKLQYKSGWDLKATTVILGM